jgi:hypothetical protein
MQDTTLQASCSDLLLSLVNSLLSVSGPVLTVPVSLTNDWKPSWPASHTPTDVVLHVHNGYVAWPAFVKDVIRLAPCHGPGWWARAAFDGLCSTLQQEYPNKKLHITDLMKATCKIVPFHSQLVWCLGWQWQRMALSMLNDVKLSSDNFTITVVQPGDLCSHATQMDFHLVNYMESCQAAAKNHLCFGMSTDKATICGLGGGVQGTQFSIPGNFIMYAAPQARAFFVCVQLVVMVLLTSS